MWHVCVHFSWSCSFVTHSISMYFFCWFFPSHSFGPKPYVLPTVIYICSQREENIIVTRYLSLIVFRNLKFPNSIYFKKMHGNFLSPLYPSFSACGFFSIVSLCCRNMTCTFTVSLNNDKVFRWQWHSAIYKARKLAAVDAMYAAYNTIMFHISVSTHKMSTVATYNLKTRLLKCDSNVNHAL